MSQEKKLETTFDVATGEYTERELSAEEYAQFIADLQKSPGPK